MKRALSFGFAIAFLSASFAACTMDFGQFQASGGGTGGTGTGGSTAGSGGTMQCNGGCCTANDCPAPQDPCKRATCVSNACGDEPRTDGTAIDTQTTGDCKKAVCQGGAVAQVNDDGDAFDDMNDCTTDTCSNGMPTSFPTGPGTECTSNGGKVCDGAGMCVACNTTAQCTGNQVCDPDTHTCIDATCSDGDKNGNETDVDCGGSCPGCDPGKDCNVDADCKSLHCLPNGTCAAAECNDGIKNGDETDVDCGGSCQKNCGPNQGCNQDKDCEGDQCTGANGTCVPNCNDNVKNNNETDVDCGGGTCDPCAIGDDCAGMGSNCVTGFCDAQDKCAPIPIGQACMNDGQCGSGHCTDGVCCNATCGGTCRSCNLAGSVGTCTDIAAGDDPDNECPLACNGNAACQKDLGATCANPAECASGNCNDGVCCNVACGAGVLCKACNLAGTVGTCTNIPDGMDPAMECQGNMVCDGAGACRN